MTTSQFHSLIGYLWAGLGLYWIWSARHRRRASVGEPNAFRILRFSILIITFVLLLAHSLSLGLLDSKFLHENHAVQGAGLAFTLLGIALTIWARQHLGINWSDKVEIRQDHQLVHTGPYAFFRHPIYSGVLTAVAGTALAFGKWRCLIAFALLLTSYAIKAKKEERVLESAFGDAYRQYENTTGFLLPRFRHHAR